MAFFGFEIKRKKDNAASFTPKVNDDGAVVVAEGGIYGTYVDLDGSIRTEAELVNRYRDMALFPEVDSAIDDIVNEVIVNEPEQETVELILDDLEQPERIKKLILDEFDTVLSLLEFNSLSYEIFRKWYIDGRLYYHAIIDEDNPKAGIKELRYIDPRKIRKIRPIRKQRVGEGRDTVTVSKDGVEYYMYNESGFSKTSGNAVITPNNSLTGLRISKDSIIHNTSGLVSSNGDLVLGYLHKAIKPLNMLKSMEDSLVIYRISRAPERRIFYIDVGGLPKPKAEQVLRDTMARFKNKLVYDADSGEIRNTKKHMTMLEDFWLPRRDGQRGTEISTLPGGQNLSEIDDVIYFQKKLYKSLNVPFSRLDSESSFSFGRTGEINRDEVKFDKFINRLRTKFSALFLKILERQLILKNIITPEDWQEFRQNIRFKYARDNYYAELKETEILRDRYAMLRDVVDFTGRYVSNIWVRRHVLHQSDEEMNQIDKEIKEELDNPQYQEPEADPQGSDQQEMDDQEQGSGFQQSTLMPVSDQKNKVNK